MECLCGCGQQPIKEGSKYLHGHWSKTDEGKKRFGLANFKNSRCEHGDGYKTANLGNGKGHALEHRIVLGIVGTSAICHHKDGKRENNHPSNLQKFNTRKDHSIEHQRQRALSICGHEDWRKCSFCGQYDDPKNLYIPPNKGTVEHRKCGNEYRKRWQEMRRNAHGK